MRAGKDILSGYGPDANKPQRARAECGGVRPGETVDVRNYQSPYGPIGITRTPGPGLGGMNHGNGQRPIATRNSGSPGLGGMNKGNDGSQR